MQAAWRCRFDSDSRFMKIHKVAVIRNRTAENVQSVVMFGRYTRCGVRLAMAFVTDKWPKVTCKNCLRTKA